MDYEKKYNEALKWMRELYPGLHGATKEDAEHYFPELAESEDERIRKVLMEYFGPQVQLDFVRGVPIQKIRDWLEKQKEQKPIKVVYYNHPKRKEIGFYCNKKEVCWEDMPLDVRMHDYPYHFRDGMDYYPFKPDQTPAEWNDTDMKEARENLITCCRDWERGEQTTLLPIVAVRARYFLEHLIEPKPAEWSDYKDKIDIPYCSSEPKWSEEDEKKIHFLVRLIELYIKDDKYCSGENNRMLSKQEIIEMLKSLRPQPKQEWSKEDERVYRIILNEYQQMYEHRATSLSREDIVAGYNFLKSLRPSWKPSEEQMNCLCAAVDAAIRKHNESVSGYKPARVLKSLYEQLQKL